YLALFAQHPVLAPQPGKLLPLLAGEPIEATAPIALRLRHPVANRLGGRLELLREIVRTTPCAHQLHHSAPVFRRIPCMTLGHRGSPPLSPLRHCPRNRVNSSASIGVIPNSSSCRSVPPRREIGFSSCPSVIRQSRPNADGEPVDRNRSKNSASISSPPTSSVAPRVVSTTSTGLVGLRAGNQPG